MTKTSPTRTDLSRASAPVLTSITESAGLRRAFQRGFTLVELLVVVALIGLISFFALPKVSSIFKLSLNKTSREMASIIKEAYNSTLITGKIHRLAYDLKENSFWVESGPNTSLLDTAESKEKEKRRKRFLKTSEPEEKSQFAIEKTVTPRKITLPRGVEFKDIVTEQSQEPITEGVAHTHFFPHGVTEQTLIHLKDNEQHEITLMISPLVGTTHLIEGYAKGGDVFGKSLSR